MTNQKTALIFKSINALLFILFVFLQYNGVFNIKILSANPMLPLALLTAFCMFSSEITSTLMGLVVGIFIDGLSSTPQGFNTILFMIIALAVCLISKHLFNNNIFAAFALCLLCCSFYYIVRWIFCFAFSLSLSENLTYIMRYALPSIIYTAVLMIPLYLLQKFLYNKFYLSHNK